jgi:predicted dehydrogenase
VDVPEPAHLLWRLLDDEQHSRTFQYTDSVAANMEEWADAVGGKGTYRYTNAQILHNVEILEAIVRSAETGEIVTLE